METASASISFVWTAAFMLLVLSTPQLVEEDSAALAVGSDQGPPLSGPVFSLSLCCALSLHLRRIVGVSRNLRRAVRQLLGRRLHTRRFFFYLCERRSFSQTWFCKLFDLLCRWFYRGLRRGLEVVKYQRDMFCCLWSRRRWRRRWYTKSSLTMLQRWPRVATLDGSLAL